MKEILITLLALSRRTDRSLIGPGGAHCRKFENKGLKNTALKITSLKNTLQKVKSTPLLLFLEEVTGSPIGGVHCTLLFGQIH